MIMMTDHLFITTTGELNSHWSDAFPEAKSQQSFSGRLQVKSDTVVWVEWPNDVNDRHYHELNTLIGSGKPVVVLSPMPNDAQAQTAISLGAKGYCHSFASSQQLKEVALVVTNGGLWLGTDLLQKVLSGSRQAGVSIGSDNAVVDIASLTKREKAVASAVAEGLTNREISEKLSIGERTVKSHLSIIFQKLDIRDRVQLALLLNNIKI